MLGIKRIYIYFLKNFIPVFAMTFSICLFLVLMQFLWKYIEDMVGKGLDTTIIAELFFYAALSLIPLALPLAILLASLMTFGNMGEDLELLATKAAGIPLIRTMKPLIVLMIFISIGAFFFQNDAMPHINVKFATLLSSVKMKSPELDIPEGSFYNEINNYSLFVKEKNKDSKVLKDVMIYDTSKGFNNMAVIVCDSAIMETAASKDFLKLTMFSGQQFANFNQSGKYSYTVDKFVPYSRENFKTKEVIIPFDGNFNRMNEAMLQGSQISKNIYQLKASIDSISREVDSLNIADRKIILTYNYLPYRAQKNEEMERANRRNKNISFYKGPDVIDLDTLINSFSNTDKIGVYSNAISSAENDRADYLIRSGTKMQAQKSMRAHLTEFHRKFTLSFACLVFFFIGAPLGAIIRKGGLGMPVVISVILFIIYYIIDNVGYKMARDGVWVAWQGVWLSSFILFPLGVFLTYKANNDSTLFNPEAYGKFIRKILLIKPSQKLSDMDIVQIKKRIPAFANIDIDAGWSNKLAVLDNNVIRSVVEESKKDYNNQIKLAALSKLNENGADINNIIEQQDSGSLTARMKDFMESSRFTFIGYAALIVMLILNVKIITDIIVIIYGILFVRSMIYYFAFYRRISKNATAYHIVTLALSFLLYPVTYFTIIKMMRSYINKVQIIPN